MVGVMMGWRVEVKTESWREDAEREKMDSEISAGSPLPDNISLESLAGAGIKEVGCCHRAMPLSRINMVSYIHYDSIYSHNSL